MTSRRGCLTFVWTLGRKAGVVCLNSGHLLQLDSELGQVQSGDLLVEDLWQDVYSEWVLSLLGLPEGDLCKDLVGEGHRHDERRVSGSTSEVDQSSLGEKDDVVAVWHQESVDLGLDVRYRLGVCLEPGDIDFDVEVSNVADDGIVTHNAELLGGDDVTTTSRRNKDLCLWSGLIHVGDLETLNSSLKSIDWVNLSDDDTSSHRVKSSSTSLTDITVTSDDSDLSTNHDIGSSLDSVNEGLLATEQVVELGLCDGVVDIDRWNLELALSHHLVQVVNSSGGLLRNSTAVCQHLWVFLVNEGSEITTVIKDHVEGLSVLEGLQLLLNAPEVLLLGLTLPGEDWDTCGCNGSGGVVLGREDVAGRPSDLSTKVCQGLDEDCSLHGHVKTTSNSSTLEWLLFSVLLTLIVVSNSAWKRNVDSRSS